MRLHNRQVKADFWRDTEIISAFTIPGRMFYQGLWQLADDSGCLDHDILSFKLHLFPLDQEVTPDLIKEWVDQLIKMGKAIPYETEGKKCLYLKNFHKHQTLKTPSAPTVPLPSWITWQPYPSNSRSGKYVVRQHEEDSILQSSYGVLTDGLQKPSNLNLNQEPLKDDDNNARAREEVKVVISEKENATGEIVEQFEQEFGRPLSPMESQEISQWMDNHPQELITQALKEAVIRGAVRIKYIDSILDSWKKNSISTLKEALEYQEQFQKRKKHQARGDPTKDTCEDLDNKYADIYMT